MYYSEEVLQEVRSRNDIVDVISAYVKLKRTGSSLVGLCPFHNEKTPSFTVTPRKQMFYCFGCHKGGSVITFTQLYENCSFQEAVQMLAARGGVDLPEETKDRETRQKEDRRRQLLDINRMAGAFYYYNLRSPQGKQGLDYLKGRGLSDEIMHSFGLGYAGKYSDGLYRYMKKKEISDDLLRASGLFSFDEKKGMYDKFWNRVMFPIMDLNNRIIGFGGRVMGDAKPKYLNSPENELFNKRRNLYGLNIARRSREKYLILCEGYMDVIAMHQAGFTNAVASLGTALTEEHALLLRRYTQQVILSYDSDSAGVNAALRAIPMLKDAGVDVKVLQLSPWKDPDEFIKANGTEAFRERLEQARNSFLFEIDALRSRYNLSDPDEKIRFLQEVAAKIASYELQAVRESYIEAAAPLCDVGYDALRQMTDRILTGGGPARREIQSLPRKSAPRPEDGLLSSQKLLLGWLTRYPGLYPAMKDLIAPEDFKEGVCREAARLIYGQLEEGRLDEGAVLDHFTDPEEQGQVAELFHGRLEVSSEEALEKAIRETIIKVAENAGAADASPASAADLTQIQKKVERKRALDRLRKKKLDLHTDRPGEEDPADR